MFLRHSGNFRNDWGTLSAAFSMPVKGLLALGRSVLAQWLRARAPEPHSWVHIPAPPFVVHAVWDKSLNLVVSWFSYL